MKKKTWLFVALLAFITIISITYTIPGVLAYWEEYYETSSSTSTSWLDADNMEWKTTYWTYYWEYYSSSRDGGTDYEYGPYNSITSNITSYLYDSDSSETSTNEYHNDGMAGAGEYTEWDTIWYYTSYMTEESWTSYTATKTTIYTKVTNENHNDFDVTQSDSTTVTIRRSTTLSGTHDTVTSHGAYNTTVTQYSYRTSYNNYTNSNVYTASSDVNTSTANIREVTVVTDTYSYLKYYGSPYNENHMFYEYDVTTSYIAVVNRTTTYYVTTTTTITYSTTYYRDTHVTVYIATAKTETETSTTYIDYWNFNDTTTTTYISSSTTVNSHTSRTTNSSTTIYTNFDSSTIGTTINYPIATKTTEEMYYVSTTKEINDYYDNYTYSGISRDTETNVQNGATTYTVVIYSVYTRTNTESTTTITVSKIVTTTTLITTSYTTYVTTYYINTNSVAHGNTTVYTDSTTSATYYGSTSVHESPTTIHTNFSSTHITSSITSNREFVSTTTSLKSSSTVNTIVNGTSTTYSTTVTVITVTTSVYSIVTTTMYYTTVYVSTSGNEITKTSSTSTTNTAYTSMISNINTTSVSSTASTTRNTIGGGTTTTTIYTNYNSTKTVISTITNTTQTVITGNIGTVRTSTVSLENGQVLLVTVITNTYSNVANGTTTYTVYYTSVYTVTITSVTKNSTITVTSITSITTYNYTVTTTIVVYTSGNATTTKTVHTTSTTTVTSTTTASTTVSQTETRTGTTRPVYNRTTTITTNHTGTVVDTIETTYYDSTVTVKTTTTTYSNANVTSTITTTNSTTVSSSTMTVYIITLTEHITSITSHTDTIYNTIYETTTVYETTYSTTVYVTGGGQSSSSNSMSTTIDIDGYLTGIETYDTESFEYTISFVSTTIITAGFRSGAAGSASSGSTSISAETAMNIPQGTISNSTIAYTVTTYRITLAEGLSNNTFVSGRYYVVGLLRETTTLHTPNTSSAKGDMTVVVNYLTTVVRVASKSSTTINAVPSRYHSSNTSTVYYFNINGPTKTVGAVTPSWTRIDSTSYIDVTTNSLTVIASNGILNGTVYDNVSIIVYATTTMHYIVTGSHTTITISSGYSFLSHFPYDIIGPLERTLYILYITSEFLIVLALIIAGTAIAVATNKRKWLMLAGLIFLAAFIIRYGPHIVDFINNW